MARTLSLFVLTIAAGLAADRLPAYREAIARFEMGRAFLFTLPAIVLALVTYFSGWEMRRQQSESLARYRLDDDALLREARGEEPERIPFDRIEHLAPGGIVMRSGAQLPFYAHLIEDGATLLAGIHRGVARSHASPATPPPPLPEMSAADLAPRPESTAPPWPSHLPRPEQKDHARWAEFYERAQAAATKSR